MSVANPLKPSERMKIPRQHPAERPAGDRILSFEEVSFGFDEERARLEAQRCLECREPACVSGCPVEIDIRTFLQHIMTGDFGAAGRVLRQQNSLPAICGRVCPQETQCEEVCILGKKYDPVAIGKLERFVADYESTNPDAAETAPPVCYEEKIAVVGSGPAGLTCAADLAKRGYRVTVFEALHAVGGVLRYGIPEFRLPKRIVDEEADRVRALGVEVITDFVVGRTATVDDLFSEWGFSSVFLGTGAGTPVFMGIPGEQLVGVYSANEFLTRVNLMGAYRFPEVDTPVLSGSQVAVIGGGNTAMDAVRTARRLGAERAMLLYRRSREEMPARAEEVVHAEEEGIELEMLTAPTRLLGDDTGRVCAMECIRMKLGDPDASGRRSPVPIPGSEYTRPVDLVIEAIGQTPNPIVQATTPGLATGRRGVVTTDGEQATTRPGVFAGGDVARGGATVILAMRDGKQAARAIHEYLRRGVSAPQDAQTA